MRRSYHALVCVRLALFLSLVLVVIGWATLALADEDASAPLGALDGAAPAPTDDPSPPATTPPPPPSAPAPATPSSAPVSSSRPTPSASASPSSPPLPGVASALPAAQPEIKVRDKVVFVVRAARAGRSSLDRAKAANTAIEALLAHPDQLGDVRFEEAQGTAVVFIGKTPFLTLGPEDVEASGEASLGVLAAQVTTRTADAVSSERKRSAIATTVFSISLLVFSALIAFWLLGRAADLAEKLRTWMAENPERVTAIRLGKIELVSAGATRGGSSIALTLGYRLTQIAIGYAWLIFGLSLFESTRGYTERLTGLMVTPLYALATRVGGSLPVFLVAGIAVLAVSVLVRFVGLFFDSVARGDTKITWLARDLARPTSALVRFGVVVVALVLASPLITGEADGALSRLGMIALVAVALGATPLLASAAVGVVVVYGRRLRRGELVEFGGRAGRVQDVRLLDVRLEDAGACEVTVPHLLGLFHPTRVHRHPPLTSIDIVVDPLAPQAEVERALLEAARSISSRGRVELVYLDAAGAHWRVHSATHRGERTLGRAVQDALGVLDVGLGRRGALTSVPRPIAAKERGPGGDEA
jgi:small-conductance mechanosensitive channel